MHKWWNDFYTSLIYIMCQNHCSTSIHISNNRLHYFHLQLAHNVLHNYNIFV